MISDKSKPNMEKTVDEATRVGALFSARIIVVFVWFFFSSEFFLFLFFRQYHAPPE